jgi:hypothetical protein
MTSRLSDEQIAELERLEREATPGPWKARPERRHPTSLLSPWGAHMAQFYDGDTTRERLGKRLPMDENAALSAAARNALPSLLAEVRASRASPPAPRDPEMRLGAATWRDAAIRWFCQLGEITKAASTGNDTMADTAGLAAWAVSLLTRGGACAPPMPVEWSKIKERAAPPRESGGGTGDVCPYCHGQILVPNDDCICHVPRPRPQPTGEDPRDRVLRDFLALTWWAEHDTATIMVESLSRSGTEVRELINLRAAALRLSPAGDTNTAPEVGEEGGKP